MKQINAIETNYAGCRFRSRLEARWAVFFDTFGVSWNYEPEGFVLDDGTRYLPDFYLPSINTWFEVKGKSPDEVTWNRLWSFDADVDGRLVIAVGNIPDPRTITWHGHPKPENWPPRDGDFDMFVWGDENYAWCHCPGCGKPGIEFMARCGRVCGSVCWQHDSDHNGDSFRVVHAYAAARSARFEHGERGRDVTSRSYDDDLVLIDYTRPRSP